MESESVQVIFGVIPKRDQLVTDFDPIKAMRDELTGWKDVLVTISQRERVCEAQIAGAETELNAVRKLKGAVRIIIDKLIAELRQLEQER